MSRILARRRASTVLVLSLATVLFIGAVAAIGIAATQHVSTIELELFPGNTGEFRYEGASQTLETSGRRCELSSESINGDIMVLRGLSYDKKGNQVDPAPVGIVGQRLGVDKEGNGRNSSCGRIDSLDRGDEILKMALGSGVDQLIERAVLDIEAGANDVIEFRYLKDGGLIATNTTTANGGGQATAQAGGNLFDELWISTPDGNIAVLGGVFYLEYGIPDVAIEVVANGADPTDDDPNYIRVDSDVTWTYTVTNYNGEGPATIVSIVDTPGGSITETNRISGDTDNDGLLDTGEMWVYQRTGTAGIGATTNSVAVFVDELGPDPADTDTSGYFGASPEIDVTMTNDGEAVAYSKLPHVAVYDGDGNRTNVGWTYTVANTGNVALAHIAVTDDLLNVVDCPLTLLDVRAEMTCSATSVTDPDQVDNTATAVGTPAVGVDVSDTSENAYFGSDPSMVLTVYINGEEATEDPVVVVADMEEGVTWRFVVENTGNVPIDFIAVSDSGDIGCDVIPNLVPVGSQGECSVPIAPEPGESTTVITAVGSDPLGAQTSSSSGTVGYYGGLDCGQATPEAGGPDPVDDAPRAIFVIGPDKNEEPCAVPVEVTSSTTGVGGTQEVNIAPPSGYTWGGVTGVVTIEWDVEIPDGDGIARTLQVLGVGASMSQEPVPWCEEVVGIAHAQDVLGEPLWYYELNAETPYSSATGLGDICLIFQNTATVAIDDEVYTKTTEAYYLWNDPRLIR